MWVHVMSHSDARVIHSPTTFLLEDVQYLRQDESWLVNENTPYRVTYVAVNEAKDDRNKESLQENWIVKGDTM